MGWTKETEVAGSWDAEGGSTANYVTETEVVGNWDAGHGWYLGEVGIWLGLPGLYLGWGLPHRIGAYADEAPATGKWGDE